MHVRFVARTAALIAACATALAAPHIQCAAQPPSVVYLSDEPHLIAATQQGWGELGLNVCAHAPGVKPLPLQIGDRVYARGIGTHAPGEITVDIGGDYAVFESEVGVEKQQWGQGSVVFRVFVDGRKLFDSGVMRESDGPKSVRVDLRGADELRLVVTDAGDGIACDCANWAEARLTRNPAARRRPAALPFDIAPFARVVTWDPARMDGARSNRVQEFRAEDLFLETDVPARPDGSRLLPVHPAGRCIGLQWLERRRITWAGLVFTAQAPALPSGLRAEVWVGESAWQGRWVLIAGEIQRNGALWRLDIDPARNPDAWKGVRKLRWVIPSDAPCLPVRRLVALTPTPTATVRVWVRGTGPLAGRSGTVCAYNGALVGTAGDRPDQRLLLTPRPKALTVRYTRPRSWRSDRTVLRFTLPTGALGVAVDDVLARGVVWVPSAGLTVSLPGRATPRRGLTVLERVRRMPDQTLARAMRRTRNPIQNLGPMMLSLACDNRKFVVERAGAVTAEGAVLTPVFGSGRGKVARRYLSGAWLPAPVSETVDGAVTYTQRTYVAPAADSGPVGTAWCEERPVCVVEFTVANRDAEPADVALGLALSQAGVSPTTPAEWSVSAGIAEGALGGRPVATVDLRRALNLRVGAGSVLRISGSLAAGQSCAVRVLLPTQPVTHADRDALLARTDLFDRMAAHWRRILAPAARVELPDRFLTNLIRASQVHCMIATRNEADGARLAPWAAASVYGALESESHSPIRGMDMLGNHEYARRCLDYFISRYSPAGYLTTGYTLMGTGWHLQTLGQHYALTHDRAWMRGIAPEVARVCAWVARQRAKTMRRDPAGRMVPEYGLMPPGVMADWNSFAYYFCLNGYYCAGIREAGRALSGAGNRLGARFQSEAAAMARDILRAYRWTQARRPVVPLQSGEWVPAAPSQVHVTGPTNDFFPGEDGNRSWCYDVEVGAHQLVPQGVIAATGVECARMMDRMEDADFLSDGWFDYPGERSRREWFDRGGFSKVQPYYCRNAEIYALRDDVQPFLRSYLNTIAAMVSSENLSFWEHFRNAGAWSKTHETGYFLQQSRFLLAMERGPTLQLAPFVPRDWLRDGRAIAVDDLPTRFGPVSYRIRSRVAHRAIDVIVAPPRRTRPDAILVRLRHPGGLAPRSVLATGIQPRQVTWRRDEVRIAQPRATVRMTVMY